MWKMKSLLCFSITTHRVNNIPHRRSTDSESKWERKRKENIFSSSDFKFTQEIKSSKYFQHFNEALSFSTSTSKEAKGGNVNFKNLIRRNVAHLRQFVIQLARNIHPLRSNWMLLHVHCTSSWSEVRLQCRSFPCHNKLPASSEKNIQTLIKW